jgi:hypothetical protein
MVVIDVGDTLGYLGTGNTAIEVEHLGSNLL